jgi:hypothetical protein
MNIHLPAILMFTRGTRFWHTAISVSQSRFLQPGVKSDLTDMSNSIQLHELHQQYSTLFRHPSERRHDNILKISTACGRTLPEIRWFLCGQHVREKTPQIIPKLAGHILVGNSLLYA